MQPFSKLTKDYEEYLLSPLPDANWCLVDLVGFLIDLLRLSGEHTVKPELDTLATRMSPITSGKKRG